MWRCPECKLLISAVGTALAFPPLVSIERSATYSLIAATDNKLRHMRTNTNRRAKVHKKQQLITPSLRFPLLAGGTKTLRFPSRSGGNLKEGAIHAI
jgi:hypothetical protein